MLPVETDSEQPSFSSLVREYSRDVPVRALLDELQRIGAASRRGELVALEARGYIPVEDMQENIRIFGTAAADLMGTMDHNIAKESPSPFIQRTVSYADIPEELLARIRERSTREGQEFLLQVNDWLADCDREQSSQLAGSGRVRAGIGLYYFEQRQSTTDEGDQ